MKQFLKNCFDKLNTIYAITDHEAWTNNVNLHHNL